MLLGGRAEVFGAREDQNGWHFAALDRVMRLVAVVGQPDPAGLRAAIDRLPAEGSVLTPAENQLNLPGWEFEIAIIYSRDENYPEPEMPPVPAALIDAHALDSSIPEALRKELQRASSFSPIAAAFAGREPVSFCYGVPTETLWDVSIDTLADFRGRGYAMICFNFLASIMSSQGKRPVWGALESNVASQRLAKKLGFSPIDRMAVYMMYP